MSRGRKGDPRARIITPTDYFVLDSIPPEEYQIGRRVYDNLSALLANKQSDSRVHRHEIRDAKHLNATLSAIADRADEYGLVPLLHFECHGDQDGIQLADGKRVPFFEFQEGLRRINLITRCRLLVTMSMCHGAYLAYSQLSTDRAMLWALVGPVEECSAGELEAGFSGYYSALINQGHGDAALAAWRAAVPSKNLQWYPAEGAFKRLFRGALNRLQRVGPNSAVARKHFNAQRRHHFMIDLFPENESRFPFAYSDVWRSSDPERFVAGRSALPTAREWEA